ncbi:uncharacterized protein GJ701_011788 [Geothlypis trichas]
MSGVEGGGRLPRGGWAGWAAPVPAQVVPCRERGILPKRRLGQGQPWASALPRSPGQLGVCCVRLNARVGGAGTGFPPQRAQRAPGTQRGRARRVRPRRSESRRGLQTRSSDGTWATTAGGEGNLEVTQEAQLWISPDLQDNSHQSQLCVPLPNQLNSFACMNYGAFPPPSWLSYARKCLEVLVELWLI